MNPRKKFKPRNSNSSSENETGPAGQCDRQQPKSSPTKHSPSKQRLNHCNKNSPSKNANSQRGSPQKCSPAKRQLQFTTQPTAQHQQPIENRAFETKARKSPNKNVPPPPPPQHMEPQPQPEDYTSPKLSFSSPNAADVPLPPTHWFSGCAQQYHSTSNITNQLKTLLNVV